MRKQKFFLFFLGSSIVTCGISISLSQTFLFLSFLFFWSIPEKRQISKTPLLWSGLAIFGTYFLSFLVHSSNEFHSWKVFFSKQSEFKDFLLFSAFLVAHNLSSEEIKKVKFAFYGLVGILIFTGFISIFSKVRLAVLLSEFFRNVSYWRFTHHYGDILGIGIHLPIGLMNTHLTFGGLLMLFAPLVFFEILEIFKTTKNTINKIFLIILGLMFILVFFLNNARSAIFGAGISIIFGLYDYGFVKKQIDPKKFLKVIAFSLGIIIISFSLFMSFEPTSKVILPLLGSEKHTDSGRTFIWDSTFPLIQKNFLFGVMPGMYNTEIEKTRFLHSEKYPELAFFYEVTQRGHAHNDVLHLFAISGVGAVLAFLTLFFFIGQTILEKISPKNTNFFYGLIGFFFAGLLQCYFQDDEVVIVFWFLVGLLNSVGFSQVKKI
jgi:hypothetical protein